MVQPSVSGPGRACRRGAEIVEGALVALTSESDRQRQGPASTDIITYGADAAGIFSKIIALLRVISIGAALTTWSAS